MSYRNFIPTVWAEAIERDLARKCVFAEDCNQEYEGNVQKSGDTVRILGGGKPTISKQIGGDIVLDDPEKVPDTSVSLLINHIAYFNYKVDDIDRRQAVGGVMEALNEESSEGLANSMDEDIAALAAESAAPKLYKSTETVTVDNILKTLDLGLQKLQEHDVPADAKVVATVPPWYLRVLRQAYTKLDTDNSAMLKNGRVGRYNNNIIKMSNNCSKISSGGSNIMLRTKHAVAFVNALTHTEAFRPEKGFSDAVKGFCLYGCKIVRPKELIVLNVKEG